MKLELHVRGGCFAETLQHYAERRFRFALRRFSHHIRRLQIHIEDLNGPRGGVDKQCRILAAVAPSGTLVVEERDARVYEAMDRAADRLRRRVRRDMKRRQVLRRGKGHGRSIRYPGTIEYSEAEA